VGNFFCIIQEVMRAGARTTVHILNQAQISSANKNYIANAYSMKLVQTEIFQHK
jgi:hypothetical protein